MRAAAFFRKRTEKTLCKRRAREYNGAVFQEPLISIASGTRSHLDLRILKAIPQKSSERNQKL